MTESIISCRAMGGNRRSACPSTTKNAPIYGPGIPTLDQLRVFLTVFDTGSFAGAARALGRATSVISYTISNLEAQLGVSLFDRGRSKRPQLTVAGRAVVLEARKVLQGIHELRRTVRCLSRDPEVEVALGLDVMMPASRVTEALRAFRAAFPSTSLRLRSGTREVVANLVRERDAAIGICGPPDTAVAEIDRTGIGCVELLPVAAPDHPLALSHRNAPGAAADHVQLALTDSAPFAGRDRGAAAVTWHVADLAHKRMLLLEGIGWGIMPLPMVQEDIAAGRLTRLDLPDVGTSDYPLDVIHRADMPLGPAASWLLAHFAAQAATER